MPNYSCGLVASHGASLAAAVADDVAHALSLVREAGVLEVRPAAVLTLIHRRRLRGIADDIAVHADVVDRHGARGSDRSACRRVGTLVEDDEKVFERSRRRDSG